uniref:PiggyBac transposable element-derived protein 4-like n=1 Tax=Saccoglossus kowalevskii TaxID=10224 RepID=A0ABM0ML37_SACKO|nr:PREDICTED: piggyBac transposable element-derived protein 4-like [Saccoglossus kowalevskii]
MARLRLRNHNAKLIEETWRTVYTEPAHYSESEDDSSREDDDGWSTMLKKRHTRPFTGNTPGPSIDLGKGAKPIDAFYAIFPRSLVKGLWKETNRYANWCITKNGGDRFWSPASSEEISALIGIIAIMGVDSKPEIADYWSTYQAIRNDYIANIMSRNRYQKLMQYFHCNNPENDPMNIVNDEERRKRKKEAPLYKVQPVLDAVFIKSRECYNMHRQICIDESIVGYKGRYGGVPTVSIQRKPNGKGFKIYALADSKTGYNYRIEIMSMTGSHEQYSREVSRTRDLCERLIIDIRGRHHILYTDSYYTSVDMVNYLLENHEIYVVGSVRQDRVGFPNALRTNPKKNKNHKAIMQLERGQFVSRQKDKVVAITWKDSTLLNILTTYYEGYRTKNQRVTRSLRSQDTGRKVPYSLPAPEAIYDYNLYMGGVDKSNQLRSYYTAQRQSKKWWKYMFFYLLDTAICNSWILYKESVDPKKTHKAFQIEVGMALVGGFSSRKQQTRNSEPVISSFKNHHLIHGRCTRGTSCRWCIQLGRKTKKGCPVSTVFRCQECSINLCKGCFLPYHHVATGCPDRPKTTQTDEDDLEESRKRWDHDRRESKAVRGGRRGGKVGTRGRRV